MKQQFDKAIRWWSNNMMKSQVDESKSLWISSLWISSLWSNKLIQWVEEAIIWWNNIFMVQSLDKTICLFSLTNASEDDTLKLSNLHWLYYHWFSFSLIKCHVDKKAWPWPFFAMIFQRETHFRNIGEGKKRFSVNKCWNTTTLW